MIAKKAVMPKNNKLKEDMIDDELALTQSMNELSREIKLALMEWDATKHYFQMACGHEQVDFAAYAMLAAEKKYIMLLTEAKKMNIDWTQQRGFHV